MATGDASTPAASTPAQLVPPHPSHRGAPALSHPATATSPPSKRELASWWKKFRKTTEKSEEKAETDPGIFGVPLADSIRYANVAISLTNEQGESFIYGYVPIVVAKCGVFLKQKATDVEGIFRLSGSAKRIKDLQTIFNSPDRYGKGLDWTGYTVHDAANILRRYLNQLPEPIVPLDFYERFREPLRPFQARQSQEAEGKLGDMSVDQHGQAVAAYQKLITELPPLNRQLLLYILDLLAVFASKSDLNRMTAVNLAAIFQPGIISHPQHDMAIPEYRLSQDVLIFLIENQDNFLIGMTGTALDEKTVQEVESGATSARTPKTSSIVGRSASNASAGADSLRKYGVRRNVSVSSRNSRGQSPGVSGSGTPTGLAQVNSGSASGGLGRSNTVPSKRSPAIASARFNRSRDASATNSPAISSPIPPADGSAATAESSTPSTARQPSPNADTSNAPATAAPPRPPGERKLSGLFSKSPIFGASDTQKGPSSHPDPNQSRQPRKLQKRQRIPNAANDSAGSSVASLHDGDTPAFQTPLVSPDATHEADPISANPLVTNTAATPVVENQPPSAKMPTSAEKVSQPVGLGLQPPRSPPQSLHSGTSVTDHSEFDTLDAAANATSTPNASQAQQLEKKKHRWRFSSSAKKSESNSDYPLVPPPAIGGNAGARGSASSIGSSQKPSKSLTGDSQATQPDVASAQGGQSGSLMLGERPTGQSMTSSHDSSNLEAPKDVAGANGEEKRGGGLFGKWKAYRSERKEEKEREKEMAKSPPPNEGEPRRSLNSASALSPRGRSLDKQRGSESGLSQTGSESGLPAGAAAGTAAGAAPGSGLETVNERPNTEAREVKTMTGLVNAPPLPTNAVPITGGGEPAVGDSPAAAEAAKMVHPANGAKDQTS